MSALPHDPIAAVATVATVATVTASDAARAGLPDDVRAALQQRFGARCSLAASVREQHGRGEAPYAAQAPDAVVFAENVDEVRFTLALCNTARIPVVAHGAGSSLEGQLLATRGGVCIDMTRMNRIVRIDARDFTATVEAGVTKEELNTALRAEGLFFPVDPGAHATLGGMAATRASGTNTVRYGWMRENVRALTVVTAEGEVVRTGSQAIKSAAGYNLTRLFVGSEGTRGIITEVTLRLYPLPENVAAAVVTFPDPNGAVATVIDAVQAGIPIARGEYLCVKSIRAIRQVNPELELRERPTLFVEFHGSPASLAEQIELLRELALQHGGDDFQWAERPEQRNLLWQARHNAYYSCGRVRAGSVTIATDTCVPRSRLAESIEGAARIMEKASFPSMIFGHVGDGNFHVLMILDPDNATEREEAERLNEEIVALALSLGGTCTGEHGIGFHKKEFLVRETGAAAVGLMRRIRAALDPPGILNPDKISERAVPPSDAFRIFNSTTRRHPHVPHDRFGNPSAALSATLTAVLAATALLPTGSSFAQDRWPSRAVTMISPYNPGGTNDVVGRLVAERLQKAYGQPFIVENQPGAAGIVGTQNVIRAKGDGCTLLAGNNAVMIIQVAGRPTPPYDPVKQLTPIMKVVDAMQDKRVDAYPQIPTMTESGGPYIDLTGWFGVAGPAGLPAEVVDRITAVGREIAADPEAAKIFRNAGLVPSFGAGKPFTDSIVNDLKKVNDIRIRAKIDLS